MRCGDARIVAIRGKFWYNGSGNVRWINLKKNIGKLPHLQHKSDETNPQAEGFRALEKTSPTNSAARNPAMASKLMSTSMRQYTRKGK